MKPTKDLSRLIEIMAALRDPQSGCPWDIEQDFQSIAPYTIEEAYEVADAIERGDMPDLEEELGDLLLQVVYHARMAEEANLFDFSDVVLAVNRKMVRRHPHVFGDETVRSAGMAKGAWERIKALEKAEKLQKQIEAGTVRTEKVGLLDGVPVGLPALVRAVKLQKKASKVGFDWDDPCAVLDKLKEELHEVEEAIADGDRNEIEGEIGDVLFVMANLARHFDIDPETAARKTNHKFVSRFKYIEQAADKSHKSLHDLTLDEMEAYWQEAKTAK